MTYSMIMGFGLGLGYSVSLAVATSWFPSRTGLVTGIVVSGFGLGPLVFTPAQMELINPDNVQVNNRTRQMTDDTVLDRVPNALVLLGALLFALQFIGMFLLRSKSYKRSVSMAIFTGSFLVVFLCLYCLIKCSLM
ncbi:hypothetical protein PHET_01176 [Paragonimus heterotremus]|uniref:Uncharacterized protein n=1 Tax=Paragonimus heterotremus TaxID=100268 RepID=A0A8J4TRX6_9TREM|nr:hypothetical protein PHET_01176 [Paragonimus heterotremus]